MPAPANAHTRAPRLLAALTVVLATLTLTACEDGEGLRDEGPSTSTTQTTTTTTEPPASGQPQQPSR